MTPKRAECLLSVMWCFSKYVMILFHSLWWCHIKCKHVISTKMVARAREFFILHLESLVAMSQLSTEQKSRLVQFYLTSRSVITTQRKYRTHFKTRVAPVRGTILRLKDKFLKTGSVENLYKERSGRPATQRTPENIAKVESIISQNPRSSIRTIGRQLGMSSSTVHRILREDLKLFPYKIRVRKQK